MEKIEQPINETTLDDSPTVEITGLSQNEPNNDNGDTYQDLSETEQGSEGPMEGARLAAASSSTSSDSQKTPKDIQIKISDWAKEEATLDTKPVASGIEGNWNRDLFDQDSRIQSPRRPLYQRTRRGPRGRQSLNTRLSKKEGGASNFYQNKNLSSNARQLVIKVTDVTPVGAGRQGRQQSCKQL